MLRQFATEVMLDDALDKMPRGTKTLEEKERYVADQFWRCSWRMYEFPLERIEPDYFPRHPDVTRRIYILASTWDTCLRDAIRKHLLPRIERFHRDVREGLRGKIASLSISVKPNIYRDKAQYAISLIASLGRPA